MQTSALLISRRIAGTTFKLGKGIFGGLSRRAGAEMGDGSGTGVAAGSVEGRTEASTDEAGRGTGVEERTVGTEGMGVGRTFADEEGTADVEGRFRVGASTELRDETAGREVAGTGPDGALEGEPGRGAGARKGASEDRAGSAGRSLIRPPVSGPRVPAGGVGTAEDGRGVADAAGCKDEVVAGLKIWNKTNRLSAPQHSAALPEQVRPQTVSRARMGVKAKALPQRQVFPPSTPAYLKPLEAQ